MTTCFRLMNVDIEALKADLPQLQEKYKELKAKGELKNPRENILLFLNPEKGIVHFNSTRVIKLNPTDPFDESRAEIEGRRLRCV